MSSKTDLPRRHFIDHGLPKLAEGAGAHYPMLWFAITRLAKVDS